MSSLNLIRVADHILSGARAQAAGANTRKDQPILPVSEPRRQTNDAEPKNPSAEPMRAVAVQGEATKPEDSSQPTAKDESLDCPQQSPPSEPPPLDHPLPPDKPSILIRMKRGIGRFGGHTKNALTHSYVNILLIFVPIGIAAKYAHLNAAVVFAMNAVAIIPLAGLLTFATESVAMRLGDTVGALLNVSFGNAVELIILYVR